MAAKGGTGSGDDTGSPRLWLGLAAGLALWFGIAWSLRKNPGTPSQPPPAPTPDADSAEFADADRIVIERRDAIYQEGLKTAESAANLWASGRKLPGR